MYRHSLSFIPNNTNEIANEKTAAPNAISQRVVNGTSVWSLFNNIKADTATTNANGNPNFIPLARSTLSTSVYIIFISSYHDIFKNTFKYFYGFILPKKKNMHHFLEFCSLFSYKMISYKGKNLLN